jgi:hypothetical protein
MPLASSNPPEFNEFIEALIGLPLSHVWRGYGSAIFFEFGALSERRRANGGAGRNPLGQWSIGIEWSWRIEGKRRIWCGSWSDDERWLSSLQRLIGCTVRGIDLVGRLPEIDVRFSNGLHLLSMMTAEGDPEWGISRQDVQPTVWASVRAGRLKIGRG